MTEKTDNEKKPRKERKDNADRRRRQLLDATFSSIVANGLAKTTLATVADEAGLSQGVAVFYYKSKNGLLTAALGDLYEKYEEHWQKALDKAGSAPSDRLVAIIEADFHPAICNPETLSVWFAFWGEQKFTPQYAEITGHFDRNRRQAIRELFEELLDDQEAAFARDVAEWIDTLTDGYWQKLHLFPDHYDRQGAIASALKMLKTLIPDF